MSLLLTEGISLGEKMELGGITAFLGIVTVFAILGLLILCIKLIGLFNKIEFKKKSKGGEVVDSPQAVVKNDDATVAAISAAIAMLNEHENLIYEKQVKFVVRSIKQIK